MALTFHSVGDRRIGRTHVVGSAVWTVMTFALIAEQGAGDAFIYFRF